MINSSSSVTNLGGLAIGVAFFGGGGLLIIRILIKTAGYLDIRAEGLFIDTYISGGFVPWGGLAGVGTFRAMGTKFLGIKVNDVDSYIASTTQKNLMSFRDRRLAQGFMSSMMLVAPMKVVNVILTLLGYTKFPESPTEADILRWNGENFGYHVCIQAFWVPNLDDAIRLISSHQSAVGSQH
jgi:hypothetical protein